MEISGGVINSSADDQIRSGLVGRGRLESDSRAGHGSWILLCLVLITAVRGNLVPVCPRLAVCNVLERIPLPNDSLF